MAGIWTLELHGFEEFFERLRFAGQAPGAFAELHELFALEAEDWTAEHWPTAPSSARGGHLLRDTGRLWQSLGGNGEGSIREVNERWARYGTDLWYAAIHNFGGTIVPVRAPWLVFQADPNDEDSWVKTKRVDMPARKFMPTPEDLADRLLVVAKDWFDVRAGIN